MSSRRMILVDVGNSAVKVAVVVSPCSPSDATRNASDAAASSLARPLPFLRLDLRDASWPAVLIEQSRQLFGFAEGEADSFPAGAHEFRSTGLRSAELRSTGLGSTVSRKWVVASVNGPASRRLREQVAAAAPADEWYELTHCDIAIRAELRNPAAIGIDRLLGASAAWHASEAAAPSPRDVVISIDAGSAVTVDLVRGGVFMGGAILPGLRLQLASLTEGTDLLPTVSHVGAEPLEIPGRDTVSAMQIGVMLGLSGGIDRLIEKYSEGCPSPPQVFLTGGDAATLEPLLSHSVNRRDDLVLSAIADTAPALGYRLVTEHEDGEVC